MRVFYKEDVPERLHYAKSDRVTSIVLIADLGYTIYRVSDRLYIKFRQTNDHLHAKDNLEAQWGTPSVIFDK